MTSRVPRRAFLAAGVVTALGACAEPSLRPPVTAGSTSVLPSPEGPAGAEPFDALLATRRSIRAFTTEPLDEPTIARLCWATQGRTSPEGKRTAPSAGALYPLELLVATAGSLRRYVSRGHLMQQVVQEDRRAAIASATGGQDAAVLAPTLFVVTGVVERTADKYGDRAERYVMLEAGHACQNLLLEASALGLGAVPIGSFDDDLLRAAVEAPEGELPLYVVPVGHPT